jgi:4-amino-4-deoxy-L-arabinose transferase-like glycosyltransferase
MAVAAKSDFPAKATESPNFQEKRRMDRYRALLKETWWLWIALAVFGLAMAFISPVFLITIPISGITFLWFGYVRFDEDGNFKGS